MTMHSFLLLLLDLWRMIFSNWQLVVECQLMEWSESRAVFAFPNGADNRKPLSCEESTGASRGFPR